MQTWDELNKLRDLQVKDVFSLQGCHHEVKLFVIDLSVSVDIGLVDELVAFFVSQPFAHVHHDGSQFQPTDVTISVLKF